MRERASDIEIARAIINLAESGTERIRDLGGDCDPAERTYRPILDMLGLPLPPPREPRASLS
jgi:hypothetical protein